MSTLFTVPSSVPVAKTETIPISVDFSNLILTGDTLASPASALHDQDGNAVILADPPVLNADNISVQQIVRGSALSAGKTYRLDVTGTLNAHKTVTASVNVWCPY